MLQDLQWDGCRKETDYYEKSYGSRRNSNFRDTQVDIKVNSWSFEAGLRTCQNNSSSIRYGGKGISFIRKNGHILRGGERMQVKGLFLNYKKNRRLMQYFFKSTAWKKISQVCFVVFFNSTYIDGEKGLLTIRNLKMVPR